MGRATRWLRSLWTGKKEGKDPKRSKSGDVAGAGARGDDGRHFFYAEEREKQRSSRAMAVAAATAAATDAAVAAAQAALAVVRLASHRRSTVFFSGTGEQWAAVTIQTAFRGYLARKALRALRALVKLQALVRGYLVRRQAAAALRGIQALLRAQAKARERRRLSGDVAAGGSSRWSTNGRLSQRSPSCSVLPLHGRRPTAPPEQAIAGVDDSPKIVEIDPGTPRWSFLLHRRRLVASSSDSGDEKPSDFSSPLLRRRPPDWCLASDECRSATAHSTPRLLKPAAVAATGSRREHHHRSYMAKTQSFEAKVRSQSAPKQRPEPPAAAAPMKRLSVSDAVQSRLAGSGGDVGAEYYWSRRRL
ncbi:unnamed protein product [Spirodela intermedia]|uniref:DUF4005 domain-containing protein n=2 Tax=Spirodela intermedia TaxID=51605 RepID=A0A7I8JTC1_SPIIN|nr:unnamed protein product [Spirodela intermedia]CAA6672863.1 unnamed protein product [Spirodela intermedia]CAA7410082.1 unnamed protein product [Spirodela intermedia]